MPPRHQKPHKKCISGEIKKNATRRENKISTTLVRAANLCQFFFRCTEGILSRGVAVRPPGAVRGRAGRRRTVYDVSGGALVRGAHLVCGFAATEGARLMCCCSADDPPAPLFPTTPLCSRPFSWLSRNNEYPRSHANGGPLCVSHSGTIAARNDSPARTLFFQRWRNAPTPLSPVGCRDVQFGLFDF